MKKEAGRPFPSSSHKQAGKSLLGGGLGRLPDGAGCCWDCPASRT